MHPIKKYRFNRGWSQVYVAERLLVHRNSVIEWEHGAMPRPPMLRQVAKLFGMPAKQLQAELVEYEVNSEV